MIGHDKRPCACNLDIESLNNIVIEHLQCKYVVPKVQILRTTDVAEAHLHFFIIYYVLFVSMYRDRMTWNEILHGHNFISMF